MAESLHSRWDRTAPALDWLARMLIERTPNYMRVERGPNRPTTGFMAVLIALHLCDETRLYGFGMSTRRPCAKYYSAPRSENGNSVSASSSGCGGLQSREAYEWDPAHNYEAEQTWLNGATRNFSRALTCESALPVLGGLAHDMIGAPRAESSRERPLL